MIGRFSCRCPNTDYLGFETTPETIIAAAVKAEELDYDAVFVNDHIIVDNSPRSAPWTNTYRQPVPETRMSFRVEAGRGTAAEIAADLTRDRQEAGVNAFQINLHGNRYLGQLLDSMVRFTSEVKPLVS